MTHRPLKNFGAGGEGASLYLCSNIGVKCGYPLFNPLSVLDVPGTLLPGTSSRDHRAMDNASRSLSQKNTIKFEK